MPFRLSRVGRDSYPASMSRLRVDFVDRPSERRLRRSNPAYDEVMARHAGAVDSGVPVYVDPVSGLTVFTAVFLADRGTCCDGGCRHCPFTDG